MDNLNPTYIDLKITNDDLELNEFGQPVYIYDRDVIDQDIRHAIRESGLLERLIGERSKSQRAIMLNKLRILVEADPRVLPGSSDITSVDLEKYYITADTDFGPINLGASL